MGKALALQYAKKLKQLEHEIDIVTPGVYASIAIALYESGATGDDIADIFAASQRIWLEHSSTATVDDMIKKCEEITGIALYSGKSNNGGELTNDNK